MARGLLNRFVMGLVGSALALASAILLTVPTPAGQNVSLLTIVGGTGLAFSALLLLRLLVQILREHG